ncbi:hypothetical protein [Desulfuromonas versatilis]|uniref:hypothetical protein n=1 Tax=Desulfuromonas versatilis TaxID=2802975 RepID=UPI001C85F56B|nr:hypothetical protein [Desulfuromonas versatilis]
MALLILLCTFTVLTGLATTASALLSEPVVDACCDRAGEEESSQPAPCSAADCSCFGCLPFDQPPALQISSSFDEVPSFSAAPRFLAGAEFSPAIEYPPEPI